MRLFILVLITGFWVEGMTQCGLSKSSYPVIDTNNEGADTTNISILVSGASNNNLATTLQGLCAVKLKFRHPYMKELFVELISPSGQVVTLVGGDIVGTNTSLITWDVTFVPCSSDPSPDPGIEPKWENDQEWAIGFPYTGQYHPYKGCLEQFNFGSVNGTWTLRCIDFEDFGQGSILDAELTFCQQDGINCGECTLDAGNITNQDIIVCEKDSGLLFPINKIYPVAPANSLAYDYTNIIFKDSTIHAFQSNIDLRSQPAGVYTICGIQWSKLQPTVVPTVGSKYSISTLNEYFFRQGACASVSPQCVKVTINKLIPPVTKTAFICKGSSFQFANRNFAEAGIYPVTIENGICDSLIMLDLKVIDLITDIKSVTDSLNCSGNAISLEGKNTGTASVVYNYFWSTQDGLIQGDFSSSKINAAREGTYKLVLSAVNTEYTCKDSLNKVIFKDNSFAKFSFDVDTLTCSKDTVEIIPTVSKPLTESNWTSKNGSPVVKTQNGLKVTAPGWYILTIKDQNGCLALDSVLVQQEKSFIDPEFSSDKITCATDSIVIRVSHENGQNTYSYKWVDLAQNFYTSKELRVGIAGSYTVKVTNLKNGCTKDFTVKVAEDKVKPSLSIENQTINCNQPTVNPKVTSDQQIGSYRWSGVGFVSFLASPDIQQSGQYSLEVTSSLNGCKSTGTFNVVKDTDVPNIIIIAGDLSCIIDSVDLLITPDRPITSIMWSGPLGFTSDKREPRVGLTGLYTATFNSSNGCGGTQSVTVRNSPDIPVVTFKVDSIKCGKDTIRIKILGQASNYSYRWVGPGLLSSDIGEPEVYKPGLYFVTITNPISGCSTEREVNVVDDRVYTTADIIYESLTCLKDSVQLILTNDDIKSVKYTGKDFLSENKSPYVKNAGLYEYFLVNNKGCVTQGSIEITRNETLPIIHAGYSPIKCFQDSIIGLASADIIGTVFSWKGPQNYNRIGSEVYILTGGQYTLEGTAPNGCKSQISFNIEYDTVATIFNIIDPDTLTCQRSEVILKTNLAAGSATVSWLSFNGTEQSITVDKPGMYIAEVKGGNNCISRDTIEVFDKRVYPVFEAKASKINCKNVLSTVSILLSTSGNTIKWANILNPTTVPDNQFLFNTSFDGEFKFSVTNKEGCSSDGSIIVPKDVSAPLISRQISDTINCNNPSIDIGVVLQENGIEFLWNGPGIIDVKTDSLLSIAVGGKYFLKVTGENFCSVTSEFDIIQNNQKPEFVTFADTLTCDNAKINIGVNAITEVVGYQWTGPDGFESDLKHPIVIVPGNYKVTVNGANGCTATSQIKVEQDISKPQIIINDVIFLPCDTSEIELGVTSDGLIDKYKWIFPSGDIVNVVAPQVKTQGLYSIQVTGKNGCASIIRRFEVKINSSPPKYRFMSDTISCLKSIAILRAFPEETGITFEWKSPAGLKYFTDKVETREEGLFKLSVLNSNGCRDTVNFRVMADTIGPAVSINPIGQIQCESKKVILDATASSSGRPYLTSWSTVNGNIVSMTNDYIVNVDKAGTYTFEVKNNLNGCLTKRDISINVSPQQFTDFEFDNIAPICNEVNNGVIRLASFNGTAPYQIEFNGVKKGTQTEFFNLSPGNYNVVISDSLGCKLSRQIEINKGLDLSLKIEKEILIMFGDSLLLKPEFNEDPSGLATLMWSRRDTVLCDDCREFLVRPFVNTIYNIEYSIDGFCKKNASVLVRVVNDIETAIPNIFAPSSSGNNQLFYIPQTRGIERINYIKIFNRWAENVYGAENLIPGDLTTGWDGTFNGNAVQPGVFILFAELVLSDGTVWKYQGDITLIR